MQFAMKVTKKSKTPATKPAKMKKDKVMKIKKQKKILKKPKPVKIPESEPDEPSEESDIEDEPDFDLGDDKDFDADNESGNKEDDIDNIDDVDEFKSHKESLARLRDTDPEFYKFLQENDKKLLSFNISDNEADDDDDNDDNLHKPSGELEIASDESDFEPDDGSTPDERNITLQLLKRWTMEIKTDKSAKTLLKIMKAFHAALVRVSDGEKSSAEYRVDGSAVFNAVIQLCVLELGAAVRRYLKLPVDSKQAPHKCKRFVKIRTALKGYLLDLLKLLSGVTSTNIQTVLLKHLHGLCYLLVSYPVIAKKSLRRLISLWCTAEEAVRVLSFLCVIRITTGQPQKHLEPVLRNAYISYVVNSRFVSPATLPNINFMRRSLVELYALDPAVAYKHVFLYVRQLAIQLRAAVTAAGAAKGKVDARKTVCGWQYVNSISLWASVIGATWQRSQSQLKPLAYPLIQLAIGAIKTSGTVRHLPLRFHILRTLTRLSKETKLTIPILPLILESLEIVDVNSKHKKVSMKPLDFTHILRVSKSQMQENGFKDAVVDNAYGLLLEYLSDQSASIAFPDISLLAVIRIRAFLKSCHVANYTRKLRQLIEKIEQNASFIEKERKSLQSVSLRDIKRIEAWEVEVRNKQTPLSIFYDSWRKVNEAKKMKEITNNEQLGEYNLPVLKKGQKPQKRKEREGPVELFPSDSEEEGEVEMEVPVEKPKRLKRRSKKTKKVKVSEIAEDENDKIEDVVEDIKASDW